MDQEETRFFASLTDDELKQLRDHIFGRRPEEDEVDLSQPKPKPRNTVPREGAAVGPGPIDGREYAIEFIRNLFDKPESFYEPPLDEPEQES